MESDGHLSALAETIECHARNRNQEVLVERHFPMNHAARNGQRQFDDLTLGLADHRCPQSRELSERV
jgi:hypothetical protein